MPLAALIPPIAGPPAEAAALRRAVTAALRWRVRRLARVASPIDVAAARLAPVLFHASFADTSLEGEAPGVSGLRYRRSFAALARGFALPAPSRPQRSAPLVEALLARAAPRGLALEVVVAPALHPADLAWVRARARSVEAVLARRGARVTIEVTDPVHLARDPVAAHRVVAWGALLGGHLSAGTWAAMESNARRPIEPHVVAALAEDAPDPATALALALLAAAPAPAPLAVAARLLRGGAPSRRIAEPALLVAAWAREAGRGGDALAEAVALLHPGAARPAPARDAAEVIALGRALAVEAARALRRARLAPARRAAWREAIGPGFVRALLPALAERLARSGTAFRTELVMAGRAHEVRFPGGAVLGRGPTALQARVRAFAILAAAAPDALAEHAPPPWRTIVERLAVPRTAPEVLLVVEPPAPPGAPSDPLNRRPSRALGFGGALEVRLAPGARPRARALGPADAVVRILGAVARRARVEVLPAGAAAQPAAARLAHVAALAREAAAPIAVEAGGEVLSAAGGRVRRYALERFVARPRRFVPDPDAPDLTLAPGERRPAGLGAPNLFQCRAARLDDTRAAVLYVDPRGFSLREVVFLWELEEHLRGAREILRDADPGAVLAVHLSDDVEPAVRRAGPAGPAFEVSVVGRLPGALAVEVAGTRFGGDTGRSWADAATAVLAGFRRGTDQRIAVAGVNVSAGGRRAAGLLALWARAVARRRLRIHLLLALRPYRPEAAGRRIG